MKRLEEIAEEFLKFWAVFALCFVLIAGSQMIYWHRNTRFDTFSAGVFGVAAFLLGLTLLWPKFWTIFASCFLLIVGFQMIYWAHHNAYGDSSTAGLLGAAVSALGLTALRWFLRHKRS